MHSNMLDWEKKSNDLKSKMENLKDQLAKLEAPILHENTMYMFENLPQRQEFAPHIICQVSNWGVFGLNFDLYYFSFLNVAFRAKINYDKRSFT